MPRPLPKGRRDGTGGLSPRTVDHMHRVLKQALGQAVKWELLTPQPCRRCRSAQDESRHDAHLRSGSNSGADRGHAPHPDVDPHPARCALWDAPWGNRRACAGRTSILLQASLAVLESAEQVGSKVRYKTPKNGKGRTLALSASLVEELRAHRLRQAEELLKVGVRLI